MFGILQKLALIIALSGSGLSLSSKVYAAESLIYGPEWTFTNQDVLTKYAARNEAFHSLRLRYKEYCAGGGCRFTDTFGTNKVIFDNGVEITIGSDPGVVEVQAKPMSLNDWKKHEAFIQEHVFDFIARQGMKPHEIEGAGHVNIGLQYFVDKPVALRNFAVDFLNHEGVGMVLNSQTANQGDAPYEYQYKQEGKPYTPYDQLRDALPEVDPRENKGRDIIHLFGNIFNEKFVAMGFRNARKSHGKDEAPLSESARIEIRTLRPQASIQDYIKVLEIFESRIHYLEKRKDLIPLKPAAPITDGWVALGQFADYLADAGLDWKKYKSLMPQVWRDLPEKNFIRRSPKGAPSCVGLFGS